MTCVGCSRSASEVGHQEEDRGPPARAQVGERDCAGVAPRLGSTGNGPDGRRSAAARGKSSKTMGNLWPLRAARCVPGGGFFIYALASQRPVGWWAGRAGGAVARPRWQSCAALQPLPPPRPLHPRTHGRNDARRGCGAPRQPRRNVVGLPAAVWNQEFHRAGGWPEPWVSARQGRRARPARSCRRAPGGLMSSTKAADRNPRPPPAFSGPPPQPTPGPPSKAGSMLGRACRTSGVGTRPGSIGSGPGGRRSRMARGRSSRMTLGWSVQSSRCWVLRTSG